MFSFIRIVFMTKNLKFTLPVLIAIVLGSLGFSWNSTEKDKEKLVLQLIYDALTSIHYQPKVVDDSLSSKVFDFYILYTFNVSMQILDMKIKRTI